MLIERLGNADDLPQMMATLATYDRIFGPISMQTLSLAVLVGRTLVENGETELGRRLLERVARDVVRAGGPTHSVRLAALASLRDLYLKAGDAGAAIAVQAELAGCRLAVDGPEATRTVESKARLGSLMMHSARVAEA